MKQKLLTYALQNNNLVSINEVENGINCNCVCPECKSPLIAKNNEKNIKAFHFAHINDECEGAYESAIHLLAKKILLEKKEIFTPHYYGINKYSIFKQGKLIKFEEVRTEVDVRIEDVCIRPDVIGYIRGKEVYIEFANTHFIDFEKINKLIKLNKPCIEIDISNLELNEEKLYKLLKSENNFSTWITNPKLDKEYKDNQLILANNIAKQKKIEYDISLKKKAKYQNNNNYNLYELEFNEVYKCPLQKKHLTSKLEKRHLDNNIIQSILNGKKWLGGFEKRGHKGTFIFLDKKRVWVYPPDNEMDKMLKEEITKRKILYSGLMKIAEERLKSKFGKCSECEFNVDFYTDGEKKISVCKYK